MKEQPLVSIIIPVNIDTPFLPKAISSIREQTYQNVEILIVQNKNIQSTVLSEKIPEQLFLFDSENIADLINEGLSKAKGEYFSILLPNDYYHAERIEKIILQMIDSKVEVVFSRMHAIEENGQKAIPEHPWRLWYEDLMFNTIHHYTLEYQFLMNNLAVCVGNLFFSKKLYEKVGRFNNQTPFLSRDYLLRAIPHFELHFLREELYFFRLLNKGLEKSEICEDIEKEKLLQLNYFLYVATNKPSNPNAPSPWHSPYQYYKIQERLHFHQMLDKYVQKPTLEEKTPESVAYSKENRKKGEGVTLITHDLNLGGGAPKLVLDLAIELQNSHYSPKILSLANGPLKKEFENRGIPVEIIPRKLLRWTKKFGKLKRTFLLLRMVLYSNLKTDQKIIINSSASWPFALPLSLFAPFKKINWYIHESYSPIVYLQTGLAKKLLNKITESKSFKFWFGSESTKKIWENAVGITGKVKYWSGLPTSNKNPQSNEIKNILAVGTCHPRKGTHYLVDAFITCVKENRIPQDVCLTIVGLPKKIDAFSSDLILKSIVNNLQNRIKFISCVSAEEMNEYYKKADLFVQASTLECMPLSLLQAMAEGIPIVSTDANGCAEAIQKNFTGYICRSNSSIAIADAIAKAINNKDKTREMANNAQSFFEQNYSKDVTIEKILAEINLP